jgi:SAM-dependent methyltransferase
MTDARSDHWDKVYREKPPERLSWHQDSPQASLDVLDRLGIGPAAAVIDIGGGISTLVDELLKRGWQDVSVLDISEAALANARQRLGARADQVKWHAADITAWSPERQYDLWHDRAVFHFLTAPDQRAAYGAALRRALAPGGKLVIATFALDGPEKCSGLPVTRYDARALAAAFGPEFRLIESWTADHTTPWGDRQSFQWCVFDRV